MKKHERIVELARQFAVEGVDARYAGYFALFNQGNFYEAHDVLEDLWLADRHGPNGNFYKGLIQLAGAFVHLQKNRLQPALALFGLARRNLQPFPALHEHLHVPGLLAMIDDWSGELQSGDIARNPLSVRGGPKVQLATREAR